MNNTILLRRICFTFCILFVGTPVFSQESIQVRALFQPVKTAKLSSEISAKVATSNFREGDIFEEGETLLTFDCSVLEAQYRIASANQKASKAVLENKTYLLDLNSVGELDVTLARSELEKANGELKAARYAKDQCVINAPFSGRVVVRHVNAFETVNPGDPLLDILDDTLLEVAIVIPSKWLSWMKSDNAFQISVDETGQILNGKITRFGAAIDPVSQTISIVGKLEKTNQANQLVAGMSGTVVFQAPLHSPPSKAEATGQP